MNSFPAVLLLLALIGAAVAASPEEPFADHGVLPHELEDHHDCIHDEPTLQRDIAHHGMDIEAPQRLVKDLPESEKARSFHTLAVGPIRIVIDTSNMDDTAKYCESSTGDSTDMRGGTVNCTTDNMLTTAKRNILLNNLLPRAIERIAERVSVNRVAGNLVMPSWFSTCSEHDIPAAHRSTGVSDADFVLYVSAAPTSGSSRAWAGYCVTSSGRPIAGRANFNPEYLDWELDGWSADSKSSVGTATHELMHAMGFTSSLMSLTSVTVRGQAGKVLTGTNVVAKAKEFFGCSSITGVEVDQSTTSHWEQRNLYQELMNPVSYYARSFSVMTLAYLDDLNVGYTVDYSKADSMDFGYDAGCGFLDNDCTTAAGGYGTWFCKSGDPSFVCDPPRQGMGVCSSHAYTNGCRIYVSYSNWRCNYTGGTSSSSSYGRYFGPGSRCFDSSSLRKSGSSSLLGTCVETQCPNGGAYAQFKLFGETEWRDCPLDGSEGSPQSLSGWSGTITCPPARVVCDPDNTLPVTPAPATPEPPTPPPTTETPTTAQPPTSPPSTSPPSTTPPPSTSPPGTTPPPTTTGAATPAPYTASPPTPTPPIPSTIPPTLTPAASTMPPKVSTAGPVPYSAVPGNSGTVKSPAPSTSNPSAPTDSTAANTTAAPLNVTTMSPQAATAAPAGLACSAGFVGAIRGRLRIRGDFFAEILGSDAKKIKFAEAFRRDLAALLGVNEDRVCIYKMVLGSIIVDYLIADGSNVTTVNSTIRELAANETEREQSQAGSTSTNGTAPSWLRQSASVYYTETNATEASESLSLDTTSVVLVEEAIVVPAATTESPTGTPAPLDDTGLSGEPVPLSATVQDDRSSSDDSAATTGGAIGGSIAAILLIVALVVAAVLYRRSQMEKSNKVHPDQQPDELQHQDSAPEHDEGLSSASVADTAAVKIDGQENTMEGDGPTDEHPVEQPAAKPVMLAC